MKRLSTLLLLALFCAAYSFCQMHIGAKFDSNSKIKPDSAWFGSVGPRGAWIAPDLDHDGKPELFVTDYSNNGQIYAFQAAGNDTLEMIWSWRCDVATTNSTPRTIRSGDMDGDGRGEVIFAIQSYGFLLFEWDGVVGSHNFGKKPSAIIPLNVAYGSNYGPLASVANEGGLQTSVDQFEVMDVDGDGQEELITPKNLSGTANDDFLIISADGSWEFEDQGFASFKIEGSTHRLASTNFGGGGPYAIHPADVNGDGKYELVCHNWNYGDYFMMKVTGPDTYVLPDTSASNAERFYYQTLANVTDCVSLFGGIVADLNSDGKQEVYFPMYNNYNVPNLAEAGDVSVVSYNAGDNVLEASSAHSTKIATSVALNYKGEPISAFTGVEADLDRNGKKEILIGSFYPSEVVSIEYQGGAINSPSSYKRKVLYTGEKLGGVYAYTYRDSAGVKDTLRSAEEFVSKMCKPTDFDLDGRKEVLLPTMVTPDSIAYTWMHFSAGAFVTDSTNKKANPNHWYIRSLESDVAGGVDTKQYTIITLEDYVLAQNYPNPFNPSTQITFTLPLIKKVSLIVYDMLGREVRTLINNDEYTKGSHSVVWNGKDNFGRSVATGSYVYTLRIGNMEKSLKMVLLK